MAMNDLFRARSVEFQIQKALDAETHHQYLAYALDSGDLAKALEKLLKNNSTARQHFLDIINREDDVHRWTKFVEHEQKRAESAWKENHLETLAQQLKGWHDSLGTKVPRDSIVKSVKRELENVVANLETDECVRIGLRAFRAMLWRLRSDNR